MSVLQTQSSQLNVFAFKLKLCPYVLGTLKKLTRPLRGRPIVADLYPQLGENFVIFWKAILGDTVTVRTRQ